VHDAGVKRESTASSLGGMTLTLEWMEAEDLKAGETKGRLCMRIAEVRGPRSSKLASG
jgi:hypothetical protein